MEMSIYEVNNFLHIVFGSIAMFAGAAALVVTKGSNQHKKAGKIFSALLIITAVGSFYPTAIKFGEIGPVAVITAIASIYLIITAIIAIRHQANFALLTEKFLVVIPLLLAILPLFFLIRAFKTGNYEIFAGPLVLAILFVYCFLSDISIIRNRERPRKYWVKRHLTRMIFAFGFGTMALVRIGIDLGISFEMSIVLPLLAAFVLVLIFRRRLVA